MSQVLRFPSSVPHDPTIEAWMDQHSGELGKIARYWFQVMRKCGDDVKELLHDGHPTACIGDAAFAYVNAFTAHVNVGFFRGAELADPDRLLEGTGKFMRHVKLRPDRNVDTIALRQLVERAYVDMQGRLKAYNPRMDHQLVIKFWRPSLENEDFLAPIQTEFQEALGDTAALDGYDVSAKEINLFVITPDPKRSFRRMKLILENRGIVQGVSAASRLVGGAHFTSLWPPRVTRKFKLP